MRDDVNPPFTPLKITVDGGRVPYDSRPGFDQLRSDLLAGKAVVVMNGVNLPELYARHHQDNDPTAGYDNGQAELCCLLEAAADTDPIGRLWLDTFFCKEERLFMGETENGEPELTAVPSRGTPE